MPKKQKKTKKKKEKKREKWVILTCDIIEFNNKTRKNQLSDIIERFNTKTGKNQLC